MVNYTAMKINKLQLYTITQVNLTRIMLIKVSQT